MDWVTTVLTTIQLDQQAKMEARTARFGVSADTNQKKNKNESNSNPKEEELRKKREAKFGPIEVR